MNKPELGGTMSEQQVLPELDPKKVRRADADFPDENGRWYQASCVEAEDYDKLLASLAQSEAERERLREQVSSALGSLAEMPRIISEATADLRAELARDRELTQGLGMVIRAFLAVTSSSSGSLTAKIRRRAQELLEPELKSKPVVTAEEQ